MILLFAFGFLTVYKDIDFEYRWKKLVRLTTLGKTEETLNGYAELYTLWNHDPYFLYNYGSVLNSIENYRASNDIMSECESYFNDYDIQMLIADNHLNMNELMEAEARYTLASKMCPNRFMPLYKLFGIYRDSNDQEEASRIAEKIISKPVKIPSAIVNHIKTETMSWMNEEKFVILPDTK